ncbi:MAG TPA: ATP-dependent DNA ligase [Rhodopirellula sp.]|nr:MAG: ATP-dependent DNA ligase [Saprospirales bacterium TMED214]HBV61564.1 ATP-dependent DNA ligase [Rhodopirellula sp.]
MKLFSELYKRLDSTTRTNVKVQAMTQYFGCAEPADAAWAIYFLSGEKLRRIIPTKLLRQWAAEEANIPAWLFDESYTSVGDLAETISLVVPEQKIETTGSLSEWVEERLQPIRTMNEEQQREVITDIWHQNPADVRFVILKLITGAFRVGVSKRLVTRALAEHTGVCAEVIAHRLMGSWNPTPESFLRLSNPDIDDAVVSQPYPFCLAYAIDRDSAPDSLGKIDDFAAEWKWDGIRGQLIRRRSQTFLWSRGEELMENRWPEIETAATLLPPGTVIDGEILATKTDGEVLPFSQLQRRINRKKVGRKLLHEVPVVFHAFDLLEQDGNDLRSLPWRQRRDHLESLMSRLQDPQLKITELISARSWADWTEIRTHSRERHSEGLMLKRVDAPYDVGRVRGTWWKWKVEPYTIDAVLIYAQKGHGKRSNLFSDYTFAVWKDDELVPFAKAYSGLTNAELREVDRFVRTNTKEAFGPVRSVQPELVMELAFEGLQASTRHKSGVATRFPRISRWRQDKAAKDANTLEDVLDLLPGSSAGGDH